MSHFEALAIKIYYDALFHSFENDVELRYSSNDEIIYYNNSKLTMKEHDYVFEFMFFDKNEEAIKRKVIDSIATYLTLIDDVYSEKVSIYDT